MLTNSDQTQSAPSASRVSRKFVVCDAGDDLVVRSTNRLQRSGGSFYVQIGRERLTANTTSELLETLKEEGCNDREVSVAAPHQHMTWETVDQAYAWSVAYQQGYMLGGFMFRGRFYANPLFNTAVTQIGAQLQVVAALGGTHVTYWHRPARRSKHRGIVECPHHQLIVFPDARHGMLATLIAGTAFDEDTYELVLEALGIESAHMSDPSLSPIAPIVESAIAVYRSETNEANLEKAKVAFALAYSDEVQRYTRQDSADWKPDRMGFLVK